MSQCFEVLQLRVLWDLELYRSTADCYSFGSKNTRWAWALPSSMPHSHPLWFVVSVVALTVKIRNYEEHMQKHRKDKVHKRHLLMSIDQRKKFLRLLRQTNYDVFEKTCKELGVEYTLPPLHFQRVHRRFLAKKALCIRVFQEVQKLKKQKMDLKAAAAAAKKEKRERVPENPSNALPEKTKEN